MSEQENAQLVQQLYAAFGRGDIPAILNMLADDAWIEHFGPAEVLPWARTYRGRDGWSQFFQDLDRTLEVISFEPQEYVAQGDKVVAFGHFRARAKPTGRTFEDPWAMQWTLRGGKAVGCRVYENTAAMTAALRSG